MNELLIAITTHQSTVNERAARLASIEASNYLLWAAQVATFENLSKKEQELVKKMTENMVSDWLSSVVCTLSKNLTKLDDFDATARLMLLAAVKNNSHCTDKLYDAVRSIMEKLKPGNYVSFKRTMSVLRHYATLLNYRNYLHDQQKRYFNEGMQADVKVAECRKLLAELKKTSEELAVDIERKKQSVIVNDELTYTLVSDATDPSIDEKMQHIRREIEIHTSQLTLLIANSNDEQKAIETAQKELSDKVRECERYVYDILYCAGEHTEHEILIKPKYANPTQRKPTANEDLDEEHEDNLEEPSTEEEFEPPPKIHYVKKTTKHVKSVKE